MSYFVRPRVDIEKKKMYWEREQEAKRVEKELRAAADEEEKMKRKLETAGKEAAEEKRKLEREEIEQIEREEKKYEGKKKE